MIVTFIKKDGERKVYNHAYEVFEHKKIVETFKDNDNKDGSLSREIKEVDSFIGVVYPDELDHGVEAEMEYHTDSIARVVITFKGEQLEACQNCAYNDEGSCSCFEKKSIGCPYVEEGD